MIKLSSRILSVFILCGVAAGCSDDPQPAANNKPVAKIADVTVAQTGKQLTLDGSGSKDADGDKLSFTWTLKSAPANSKAALGSANAEKATITPDEEGDYVIALVASDGKTKSDEVTAKVKASKCPDANACVNNKPTAVAGTSFVAPLNEKIALDASKSSDPEKDKLTFTWAIDRKPDTSKAALDSATAEKPSFTPDVAGSYVISLIADDGKAKSDKATIEIVAQAGALKPVARIGAPPAAPKIDVEIEIDGSGSLAPKDKTLTYAWTLKTKPTDSTATLPATGAKVKFKADKEGKYTFELKVNDGTADSELVSAEIEFKK